MSNQNDLINKVANEMLQKAFSTLKPNDIKAAVDEIGIDSFINNAALYTIGGAGAYIVPGVATVVGVPVDIWLNIIQQFRVVMAVVYHKTGKVVPDFSSFMKIVALSMGIELGVGVGKALLYAIARGIVLRLAGKAGVSWLGPISTVIVGGTNYAFIHGIGKAAMAINYKDLV
ncbi:MAG: hypothetical protein F6J86_28255 [Symploca sp. SIO1B1]|nr:hypothetical protein [Symploca sp. SIO1B1]